MTVLTTDTRVPLRRRPLLWVALFVVAAVTGGIAAWLTVTSRSLDQVQVGWAGPLACTGTEVVQRRVDGERARVPAVRMRQTMDCTLPVRVENRGRFAVQVGRVVLPYMGPGGGSSARVEELMGQRPLGKPSRLGWIDAVFQQDRQLEPGDQLEFEIRFTFRGAGCDSPRSLFVIGPMPRVVVSALGRTAERGAGRIGFIGTEDSSCDT